MSIELGTTPELLTVSLTRGADFIQTLSSTDAAGTPVDWVTGEVVSLVFDMTAPTTWVATITGPDAVWNVDKAVVTALLDAGVRHANLIYTAGDVDLVWARGSVSSR